MPYISPETMEETGQVDFLLEMMGDSVSRTEALRVYRKHKGNVERAADAMVNGDRGGDYDWDPSQSAAAYSQISPQPSKPSNTVIDLTGSDDELQRAMAMSLEREPTFGPSNRPPDSNWAMVTTNQSENNAVLSNEDKSYNDAIQASLEDFASTNDSDLVPINNVRQGARPVALRSDDPLLAYAALFIQALFSVPQARDRVASIVLPRLHQGTARDSPESAVWNLVEIFVNLDLAQLAAIIDSQALLSLMAQPQTDHNMIGNSTWEFAKRIADVIETHLRAQDVDGHHPRLMHFTHGHVELHHHMPQGTTYSSDSHVVVVEFGSEKIPFTDLISCLSGTLSSWTNTGSAHDVIIEPSDVFCFQLQRLVNQSGKYSPEPFIFPKSLYLDQFLLSNLELANKIRISERGMLDEISELSRTKEGLTRHNGRDIIKDLEGTLHYYENVAHSDDDHDRAETLNRMKAKLQNVVASLSRKVGATNYKIEKLRENVAGIYDIPELRQHQYDLRAVLMHTGLPGRKQIYSYVQDNSGTWWKTIDYNVVEVPEETVLSDPTGLHLGAGPYMLIYSRHLEEKDLVMPQWPQIFTESVEKNNRTFLKCLPPEVVTKAGITIEEPTPPTPPSSSPVPSSLSGRPNLD